MKSLCLALLIIGIFQIDLAKASKIKITLLYEFMCPDCHEFVLNQLYPNYDDFKDYMDVEFVPFGWAKSVDNGTSFVCQHGPKECEGNRLDNCVINEIADDQSKQVEFVKCHIIEQGDPLETGKKCAEQLDISWDDIITCYNGQLGTDLQLKAEKLTNSIPNNSVPCILYQNTYDESLQDGFVNHFKTVICMALNDKPPACKSIILVQ